MDISKIITAILKDNNLTQAKLAKCIDVTPQLINGILKGNINAGYGSIEKLRNKYPEYFKNTFDIPDNFTKDDLIAFRLANKYSQYQLADKLNISRSLLAKMEIGERSITQSVIDAIKELNNTPADDKIVSIKYCSSIPLAKGYKSKTSGCPCVKISKCLLVRDKQFNPSLEDCKIIKIDDDSLYPEYVTGDLAIIDESKKEFVSGYIYAFTYKNKFYVKKIVINDKKAECTGLTEKSDTFNISRGAKLTIHGALIPRVRL